MPRIVHLGTGNFHRAHQAWYTQRAGGWDITGISFRARTMPDTLRAQDCDYTLVTRGGAGDSFQRITVIKEMLFAPEQEAELHAALCDPDTHVITLTITEKGYRGGPAIPLLAKALAAREAPVTVISCDNLSHNGVALAKAIKAQGLKMRAKISFPSSMVDRITPATTDALKADVLGHEGWPDQAPVATEPFSEWVIEDNFAGPRPAWDSVGTQIVQDVAPYELRKLRMLNGAHSYLAYAGVNAGHSYVHEAIADPVLRAGALGIMAEAAQTLPDGIETQDYAQALITRFENPNLHHALRQIAMDGTQKLPMRILPTMAALQPAPHCAAALDAWARFALDETHAGRALDDPQAKAIAACRDAPELMSLLGAPASGPACARAPR